MRIILELDEEQSWLLVSALGRAWADARLKTQYKVAENILKLQRLVQERQQAGYEAVRAG